MNIFGHIMPKRDWMDRFKRVSHWHYTSRPFFETEREKRRAEYKSVCSIIEGSGMGNAGVPVSRNHYVRPDYPTMAREGAHTIFGDITSYLTDFAAILQDLGGPVRLEPSVRHPDGSHKSFVTGIPGKTGGGRSWTPPDPAVTAALDNFLLSALRVKDVKDGERFTTGKERVSLQAPNTLAGDPGDGNFEGYTEISERVLYGGAQIERTTE